MCLLHAFIRNGFCPTVIRNGRKILVMEIKAKKLRFITSNSYFNMDEYNLAKQFEIPFNYSYFPKQFIKIENFNFVGPVPDIKYFISAFDNEAEKLKKVDFVNSLKSQNYIWSFRKEIESFCDQKLWLLLVSCVNFIKDCFVMQANFETNYDLHLEHKLIPFSYPLCSLSGYVYKLYRALFLNNYDIFVIKNEFGVKTKNVSKVENEWAAFMDFQYPEKQFESAFNNVNGQRFFKEAIPDLYSKISEEAFFFNGCVFHGHHKNCLINPNATENTQTPFGKTYKEVDDEFWFKMTNLMANNSEIKEIVVRWECSYKDLRNNCPQLKQFLSTYVPHPLYRLSPRTCVRGAFFDVFALLWSKTSSPLENLYFLDINGLYSFCAINFPFMVGKYETIIGNSVRDIILKDNKFFYKSKKITGSMLVTILPPQNLLMPFLLYRTKSGTTVNTLCSICCEKKTHNCSHTDFERAITSAYMISEIEFALSLNYKLLAIHECHVYYDSAYILKDFVHYLNFCKIKYSTCLENLQTLKEKENYCNQLNKDMKLKHPFHLTPTEVKSNSRKRTFYKLMANALFGKLEQRNDKTKTVYVSEQSELENLYFSENQIQDINCFNGEICEVQIKSNLFKVPPNKNSNCYIGAQLTAYARQIIYTNVQILQKVEAKIFQVDCDSIIFALPSNKSIPLPISDAVGHFKHELENLLSYQSLGPKNYCITYQKENQIETMTKVRGLSLNNSLNESVFTDELFKKYIQQFLENKREKILVNQFRTRGNFKRFKVSSEIEKVTFCNTLSERRFLNSKSTNLSTYPFGYKQ